MRPGSAVALSPAQNRAGDHITRQRHHSGEAGSVNHKRPAKSDAVLRFSNRGQGGRSWQAFGKRKKCLQFFRRTRIC